jgi:MFS transporter, FSR family, fosmidomycin resistance protein
MVMDASLATRTLDVKVISLIGVSHFLSHCYQLALPALFPLIHRVEGIGYAELGVLSSAYCLTSGLCQVPAGFLVDRVGARPVLIGGMLLLTGSTTLFAFAPSYSAMLVLSILAGLGNAVFHPADFSILNGSVSEQRIGRGLSVHGFGGYVGYAATPISVFTLGSLVGWREAMLMIGIVGLMVVGILWAQRHDLRDSVVDRGIKSQGFIHDIGVLWQPPAILAFSFFCFMAMGAVGIMTLGASTLIALFNIPAKTASTIISLQLTGALVGTLIGGVIADKYSRHDLLSALMVTFAACLLMIVPFTRPSSAIQLVPIFMGFGLFYGIAGPLRDMVVRSLAPAGAAGKTFGFTYSGMDFGSAMATALLGYLLGSGEPFWVLVMCSLSILMGGVTIMLTRPVTTREAARASA